MIKKILSFIVISLFLLVSYSAEAQSNDFQCKAQMIGSGFLPAAPPCGTSGGTNFGPTLTASGSTNAATNDTLSGPIASCYPNAIPLKDVWYQFTASDTHVEVSITTGGSPELTNPYIAIYESATNECVGLMPRDCFSATGKGTFTTSFGPLTFGVKYYLQVASTIAAGSGGFAISLRSKNDCANCLQNSILQSYPLPVKAAYPPGDSVGFCYSVIGYKQQFGNRLHGVVPVFGNGWDVTTFKVIKTADSADFQGRWKYLKSVDVKGIKYDGFFYDVGNDNDPTNNLGDQGNPATIWTFCFTIKAKAACGAGTDDLSINFNTFSDGESGSLVASKDCSGDKDYTFKAHMNCCPKPTVVYADATLCKTSPNGKINAYGGFSILGYTYELYNNAGIKINKQTITSITSAYSYGPLTEGNYYLYITENKSGACTTPVNVYVPGPVTYTIQQTAFACGSGGCTNAAKLIITSGTITKFKWSNGSTNLTAINLCGATKYYDTLTVGTTGTCKIIDSIFINNLPPGNATFRYGKRSYCTSEPFAVVSNFPPTTGGTFTTSNTIGATVDPNTGTIPLSALTSSGQVIVKYVSGPPCNASAFDTIYIQVSPPPVSVYALNHNLCVGDPNSIFINPLSNAYTIKWYSDSLLTNLINTQAPGASYTTPLSSSTYYLTQVVSTSSICQSIPVRIKITVNPKPIVDAGSNQTICPGFGVKLNATGASTYSWQPANLLSDAATPTPIASPTVTTLFTVTGTSSGCSSSDTVTLFVSASGKCTIKIYNGFTPNGDNHNDFWYIDGIGTDEKNEVTIFNRWGEKLWGTTHYDNQTNKWEGQGPSGKLVPDGTYFYVIQYKSETFKGWVELTR